MPLNLRADVHGRGPFNMLFYDYRASVIGYTDATARLQAKIAKCKLFLTYLMFSKNSESILLCTPCPIREPHQYSRLCSH